MESLNFIVGTCIVLLTAVQTRADIDCPDIYIERGGSRVIFCQSSIIFNDFYWYRGKTTSPARPILVLEGGAKGGTQFGGDHFDIFDNGSMIMKNVEIVHESYYTFLGYNDDGNFDGASFLVNVTVSPDPPCPVITGCIHCEDCILNKPKDIDTLTCSVTGARPAIPLSWTITSQSGISFFHRKSIQQRNHDIDLWDTKVSLDYKVTESCGAFANVECAGEDVAGIISTNMASLHIHNGRCNDTMPTTEAGFGSVLLIVTIVPAVVLPIIFIGCCIYKLRKGRHMKGNNPDDESSVELAKRKVTRGSLVRDLATFYEKFCSLKPLPWGEPVPISALYSDFQCKVTSVESARDGTGESKGIENIKSSEDLFASDSFKNARRVLFIADLGYGKTTMTQQVVQQWIKEETTNFILIYIQLKEVDITKSISSVVQDMLSSYIRTNVEDIQKVLKQNEVLVLLDGLDELSMSVEENVCEEEDEDHSVMIKPNNETGNRPESAGNGITIEDVLRGKVKGLIPEMRVWVTSREVDDMKGPFPPPYVKVKMTGFSEIQIDAYLRKTCEHYCQSINESDIETTESVTEKFVKEVKDIIEKDDIIQEFVNTPLLLVLIIHILAGKVTGTVDNFKNLHFTKLTTLIRTVITCLESRYVQKINNKSIESKIKKIERKLGEIAWKQKLEIGNYDREGWDKMLGTEYVKIALSIGLLRLSKQINNSNVQMKELAFSSFTGVEFYHQYFLEYLAGEYFSTEKKAIKKLEKSLRKNSDDKTIRFLQFMSGCGHPYVTRVSEIFINNQKMWNNFADFIYETEDEEKRKTYLEKISGKAKELGEAPLVNFRYLDKKHHQDAVSAFCESCNEFNVNMRALSFRQDCPLTYLTQLTLPGLQRLDLLGMHITVDDFVAILEWITRQKLPPATLQFIKCKFNAELSDASKEKIKTVMKGKEINIHKKETITQTDISVKYFNIEKGVWKNKYFPKEQ